MKFDNEIIEATNLYTYAYGKKRKVYQDKIKINRNGDKKLYFRFKNRLHGVFIENCH